METETMTDSLFIELNAKITRLEKLLENIALINCTCDGWAHSAEIDPAPHDTYCMYRAMTGYKAPDAQPLYGPDYGRPKDGTL